MSFRIIKEVKIDELNCQLIELEHTPTGASVMHLANDDTENLFNLCFRTLPSSSNGVAHILEHTVLCGSKRFPVRDPFFGMTRRSLNTFMNALTGADFTCYPAASETPKDFYNLLDVYLDAVFYPLLTEESFLQEGHRLEFEEKNNPSSPLQYKGIVFNEMKGALASGEARLGEYLMEALFPNLTYGINSGGDPKDIPKLTYQELLEFHKTFYHPSRCLFFFYGHLPLQRHLDFIENKVLRHVKPCTHLPALGPQPRFQHPKYVVQNYPFAEDPKQQILIGFGWLTCSILDQLELLALHVLDMILMGTDAGPLKRVLLDSGLCTAAESILDPDVSEIPYLLICKGCQDEAPQKLEKVIRDALKTIAQQPFSADLIEGAVHQLEMSRTEISGHSSPYGLSLFFRAALLKQHGGQAEDGLRVHSLFAQLREKITAPEFFGALIHQHFLDNPHFVMVTLHPDAQLSQKELEEEHAILKKIQDSLTPEVTKTLVSQAQNLETSQEKEDDYNLLPTVTLQDVAQEGKDYPLVTQRSNKAIIHHYPCFTNNHLYVDLVFNLPALSPDDLPLLRLFVLLAPQLGCGGRNYKEHLDYILQHIGGAGFALDLYPQADHPQHLRPTLSVRGRSLFRKADRLLKLLRDMMQNIDFTDLSRIKELLAQHLYEMQMSIQTSSLRYAISLAASNFTPGAWINEQWYGLHYFWALQRIVQDFEKNPHGLIEQLRRIHQTYVGTGQGELVVTCCEEEFANLQRSNFYDLLDQDAKPFIPWSWSQPLTPVASQGRLTSSPVAFTAFLFPAVAYTHPDTPALSLASQIMDNTTLHKRIREQGGAYGSGATNSVQSGIFYCYAYRDPNLNSTIHAFEEAIENVCAGEFDDEDLEEAKLGLFQELDAPLAPASRGMTTFSRLRGGRTPQLRKDFRDRLRNMTAQQVIEASQQHLQARIQNAVLVSFANAEFFDKDHAVFQNNPLPLFAV
ncbi:MAG: insulinase family protein [Verrucomicrobia bacterium]|nr:insulinase family protein [Verrucomicrobiota bacterium]MBS0646038.1 insulinase family protein [Verrucomicrobiota bacterium]